jgi:hypothetical protein
LRLVSVIVAAHWAVQYKTKCDQAAFDDQQPQRTVASTLLHAEFFRQKIKQGILRDKFIAGVSCQSLSQVCELGGALYIDKEEVEVDEWVLVLGSFKLFLHDQKKKKKKKLTK